MQKIFFIRKCFFSETKIRHTSFHIMPGMGVLRQSGNARTSNFMILLEACIPKPKFASACRLPYSRTSTLMIEAPIFPNHNFDVLQRLLYSRTSRNQRFRNIGAASSESDQISSSVIWAPFGRKLPYEELSK